MPWVDAAREQADFMKSQVLYGKEIDALASSVFSGFV